MAKKTIVVVCPGRGTYTKETLGYLKNRKNPVQKSILELDRLRQSDGAMTVSELDSAQTFKTNIHTKGENAAALIYACSLADFLEIDLNRYEIVAVTGNSMGWYLALALAEFLDFKNSYRLINTMGSMMKDKLIGGQVIYPVVDENWNKDLGMNQLVDDLLAEINSSGELRVFDSIFLGGYRVLAGDKMGVSELLKKLPPQGDFPFQLLNHGAFHTPLMNEVSERGFAEIKPYEFKKGKFPVIDGRGNIFGNQSASLGELYNYTLGHQVVAPYDFSKSIVVALKEFSPDHLVLLGPGSNLGGAIGQVLIENKWHGLGSKDEFIRAQKNSEPFLLSMGMEEQRKLVVAND